MYDVHWSRLDREEIRLAESVVEMTSRWVTRNPTIRSCLASPGGGGVARPELKMEAIWDGDILPLHPLGKARFVRNTATSDSWLDLSRLNFTYNRRGALEKSSSPSSASYSIRI